MMSIVAYELFQDLKSVFLIISELMKKLKSIKIKRAIVKKTFKINYQNINVAKKLANTSKFQQSCFKKLHL